MLASLLGVALGLGACSGSDANHVRFAAISARIPADTPFALIHVEREGEPTPADASSDEWLTLFRARVLELLGVDLFDPTSRAAIGLDAKAEWALFGVGLHPAFAIAAQDPVKLEAELARLEGEQRLRSSALGALKLRKLELGEVELSFVLHEGFLLGVYHDRDEPLEPLFAALVAAAPRPDLEREAAFAAAVKSLDPGTATMLYVDVARLDAQLLARARAEDDPRLPYLPEDKRAAASTERAAFLDRCEAAGARVGRVLPYVAGGRRPSAEGVEQQLFVALAPEALASVGALLPRRDNVYESVRSNALLAFALELDFAALAALPEGDRELVRCPNLGVAEGALAVLSGYARETDLARVFTGTVLGALYGFDLNLPLLSKRRGALLFEVNELDAAQRGLEQIFAGLGFVDLGFRDDGAHAYDFYMNILRFALLPLPIDGGNAGWLALALGKTDAAQLEPLLSAAPSASEAFRFDLDGSRLEATLTSALADLPGSSQDLEMLGTIAESLAGLRELSWQLSVEAGGVRLRGQTLRGAAEPTSVPASP